MVWMLLRLATRTTQWFAIATSQLAANALSSILPAGAAAGATLQVRMLRDAGHRDRHGGVGHDRVHALAVRDRRDRAGAAAARRCCSASSQLSPGLSHALLIGAIAFVAILAIVAVLAVFDGPLRGDRATWSQSIRNRLRRHRRRWSACPTGSSTSATRWPARSVSTGAGPCC